VEFRFTSAAVLAMDVVPPDEGPCGPTSLAASRPVVVTRVCHGAKARVYTGANRGRFTQS